MLIHRRESADDDHEISTNTSTYPYNRSHASLLNIKYGIKFTNFFFIATNVMRTSSRDECYIWICDGKKRENGNVYQFKHLQMKNERLNWTYLQNIVCFTSLNTFHWNLTSIQSYYFWIIYRFSVDFFAIYFHWNFVFQINYK